jgi:hypothetical protein
VSEREDGSGSDASPPVDGLYLYGVVRARARWSRGGGDHHPLTAVRYRELEALVRPVPYAVPELGDAELADHQKLVDRLMRRGTVLPVPFGLVFQGRRAILRFLEDQYIVLDEGLSFLDGHWEMRLHMTGDADLEELQGTATRLYTDLRRFARAAIPLRAQEGRILSAAFLVDRGSWIRFVEQADDLNRAHPELVFDVTGPWPPYDFVNVHL